MGASSNIKIAETQKHKSRKGTVFLSGLVVIVIVCSPFIVLPTTPAVATNESFFLPLYPNQKQERGREKERELRASSDV